MTIEAFSNGLLGWIIRAAGLFWLFGAFMLFRQIRMEMMLDGMTSKLERMAREFEADDDAPAERPASPEQQAIDRWTDRDDAARRGWIAAQAVVLAATALAMMLLHPFAAWMAALLVIGQGAYFFWREHTARHAPSAEAALHARPSTSTVNAGWVSLVVAMLVWTAAFRGVLA
jgi:ABC-type nickel/cobalt efflux system permease component RcnA